MERRKTSRLKYTEKKKTKIINKTEWETLKITEKLSNKSLLNLKDLCLNIKTSICKTATTTTEKNYVINTITGFLLRVVLFSSK